jgi:hypothetical protein
MSAAWEVTEEDIQSVLDYHRITGIGNRVIEPTTHTAAELLDLIDTAAVELAALFGDNMEQQHEYALGDIERQLMDLGILSGPRIIG